MIVAGGCYHETCEFPRWDAVLGSGGRGACAIAKLAEVVELYTYFPRDRRSRLFAIEAQKVKLFATHCDAEVAFCYFHPLSTPLVRSSHKIEKLAPIEISGKHVLRFGFFKGDAIVRANYAVYDPQSARSPSRFRSNGSHAEHLAIVLNEQELFQLSELHDRETASDKVLALEGADVLVVKCGVFGAFLKEKGEALKQIPAYKSENIFKIGTGDVFSAVFAFWWAERRVSAWDAAHNASQAVAHYCETRNLPIPAASVGSLPAVPYGPGRPVVLVGDTGTLTAQWLFNESAARLEELGVSVTRMPIAKHAKFDRVEGPALILDDGRSTVADFIAPATTPNKCVLLSEFGRSPETFAGSHTEMTHDFATAIYWAAWNSF